MMSAAAEEQSAAHVRTSPTLRALWLRGLHIDPCDGMLYGARMTPITECEIATARGDALFRVVAGAIEASDAAVLVVSANAHADWPYGAAIEAIEERFGEETIGGLRRYASFEPQGPFAINAAADSRLEPQAGVWAGPLPASAGAGRYLVVARLSGAHRTDDPARSITAAFDAVFATLAMLSLEAGRRFDRIALSDLGGTRGYPVDQRLASLTSRLARWFQGPCGGESADLVLFDDGSSAFEQQREQWREAMRSQQGWLMPTLSGSTAQLMQEVRTLVQARAEEETAGSDMYRVLVELARRLDPAHRHSVQEIAQVGRQLAEVVSSELCVDHGLRPSLNTFDNLTRLESASHRVARWILSHLHTLRTLGNEASHAVTRGQEHFPRSIVDDDLVVLSAHVRRVLDFRGQWRRRASTR